MHVYPHFQTIVSLAEGVSTPPEATADVQVEKIHDHRLKGKLLEQAWGRRSLAERSHRTRNILDKSVHFSGILKVNRKTNRNYEDSDPRSGIGK